MNTRSPSRARVTGHEARAVRVAAVTRWSAVGVAAVLLAVGVWAPVPAAAQTSPRPASAVPPGAPALAEPTVPAIPAAGSPRLVLAPRTLAFDRAGDRGAVVVRNLGEVPLHLGSAGIVSSGGPGGSLLPEFTVEGPAKRVLQPGESTTIAVGYRPVPGRSARQAFAALVIDNDDPRWPAPPEAMGSEARAAPAPHTASVALRAGPDSALLSWLVFAPLLGIPLVLAWPRRRARSLRFVALAAAAAPLALALWLAAEFDPLLGAGHGNYGFQFVQHVVWVRAFNVEYYVGVDGLSLGLVVLTAFVSVVAMLASWSLEARSAGGRSLRGYFALFLFLETGMLGVFVALDLFLFYVFWEVVLLPMYFLVGLWGGPRREYAAIKFFLYTLAGAVLILLAILALYYASRPTYLVDGTPAGHTLDMVKLARDNDFGGQPAVLGFRFARLVWVLLFIGFAIKVPVVPVHTWLPDAHVEAPTAISVVLASVLLKMGTYGMLRVSWAILPEATRWGAPAVAALGALSILYGGLCALAQKDLKGLVAYSSIGHMGFCLLGMAALTPLGLEGAIFQMLSHGVVSALLFLLVGVLYDRTGERSLDSFGGVAAAMPRYAIFFGVGFMAALGLPGLSGFVGELMALLGSFGPYRVTTAVAALGLAISAGYSLTAIRRILFGELPERWRSALGRDLDVREWLSLLPLALITVFLGCYPAPVLEAVRTGVADLLSLMGVGVVGLGGG